MSRSRTLHLTATRRWLPSRLISATPSAWMNSASCTTGMRSPLGALMTRRRRSASKSPSERRRTARSNRRSPSKTSVRTPLRRRLDGVLNVLNVDAVPCGGGAVDHDLELGLTDEVVVIEVGDAADRAQELDELAGFGIEHEAVRAVELDGELALHAGQRFVDVVLDRLREVRRLPRDVGERRVHRLRQ